MNELFLKSISTIIPGYSKGYDGELITTEEILSKIREENSDNQSFDNSFIRHKTGIESVAFTKSSAEFVRKFWDSKKRASAMEIFAASQSKRNDSLYELLEISVRRCIEDLSFKDPEFSPNSIVGHLHISGFLNPWMEAEFAKIRQKNGVGLNRPVQTMIIQQGCSGLLTALEAGRSMLAGTAPDSNILITADNNMMVHAHQRCIQKANVKNLNQWLWPAIFGEGVGAIIVGRGLPKIRNKKDSSIYFSIDSVEQEIAETDWRVQHNWHPNDLTTAVYIKAKEVTTTYLKFISSNATRAVEKSGGLDELFRLCLHESNPRLISIMKNQLKITSDEMTPSISNKVGTLACVSSFSLLDMTNRAFIKTGEASKKTKIALVLLGEAGGSIIAGNICLTAKFL